MYEDFMTSPSDTASSFASLLRWHAEMGADETIETESVNRMVRKPTVAKANADPAPTLTPAPARPARSAPPASASAAVAEARALADAAATLADLEKAVKGFDGCPLKRTATNTVFSDGQADSGVMFIGEAPGAEEDKQGIPFCGASGQLLDDMIKWIGLSREKNCYISNTVFWRPPGNRPPTPEELAICRPFVEKHIALVKPKLIVLVGGTAIKALLDDNIGITKLRGKPYDYTNDYLKGGQIPVRVIFHPSYLMRSPMQKKQAWADLLDIETHLHELGELSPQA